MMAGLSDLPAEAVPAALARIHAGLAPGATVELDFGQGNAPDPRVIAGAGFTIESQHAARRDVTLTARRLRILPDFVGPGMRVLVCGLNPSLVAADAGFGYAGATNRFWRAAVAAGMVTVPRQPLEALVTDRVGMTDLVKRATRAASEVTRAEYQAGGERVAWLTGWLKPHVILFVGLQGWRAAVPGARAAPPGWQPEPFGGVPAYVMPSTSGLNARVGLSELTAHMREALSRAGR